MIIRTDKGVISISEKIIAVISGYAALNCFGVKCMTSCGISDGIVQLLKGDSFHKGVRVKPEGDCIAIELHIAVEHGINMTAVGNSIMNTVKYVVQKQTGIKVGRVNVYIDTIIVSEE